MKLGLRRAGVLLGAVLLPAWIVSLARPATLVIDGSPRLALGAGGVGLTLSRRDPAGLIPLDFPWRGPLAGIAFTSYGGYRGGGRSVPQLSGIAHLTLERRPLVPFTAFGSAVRIVFLPLWPALLVAGPATFATWRAWRSIPPGLCPACRYDLRALPAGSQCPECGR